MSITRRELLIRMGAFTLALSFPGCASLGRKEGDALDWDGIGPFASDFGDIKAREFSGDVPRIPHSFFLEGKEIPSVAESVEEKEAVVIGGGIAGLVAAHQLSDTDVVLLERAERLGGNSRGETWRGLDYSIGASYFVDPDPKSALFRFLIDDLGVDKVTTVKKGEDPVLLNGKREENFFDGHTDKARAVQFQKFSKLIMGFHDGGRPFPEIPERDEKKRKILDKLDKGSFHSYLEESIGGKLSPHLTAYIEHYCWAAFAGSSVEISAAAGLNFLAAEAEKVRVSNGGNATVARLLCGRLAKRLPPGAARVNSLVLSIVVSDKDVTVDYLDAAGKLRRIVAKTAMFCAPKFVGAKVIRGLEKERIKSIARVSYRSYLVANFLISKDLESRFFDLFLLGDGKTVPGRGAALAQKVMGTDLVLADYAKAVEGVSVLTLYRPMSYEGARVALLAENAYGETRAAMENFFFSQLAGPLGVDKKDVVDVRLARWGHPMPLARQGFLKERLPEKISKPFNGRLFFAQQDNWLLPCLESATEEALHYSEMAKKLVT